MRPSTSPRRSPPRSATVLDGALIASAEVARPGFVNLRVADAAYEAVVARILAEPDGWGRFQPLEPRRVDVEFVSANPTGPLHIGNARGAFVGDLLSRVLEAGGQVVTREYYFNDFGAQVRKLGASVLATRNGEPVPEDGYHGDYVGDLAAAVPDDVAAAAAAPGADGAEVLGRWASERVRAGIEASLERLGVHFDVWKSEGSLHSDGWVDEAIERLMRGRPPVRAGRRPVVPLDGVRRRQGPGPDPFHRRADLLRGRRRLHRREAQPRLRPPDLRLGHRPPRVHRADPRRRGGDGLRPGAGRGAADGLGLDPARRAGGGDVQAGRRHLPAGHAARRDRDDAARWFFASRGTNLDIEVDVDLARRQSSENPVYYVQYAHARIASTLRKAADAGLAPAPDVAGSLSGEPEALLVRAIARFPEVVEDAVAAQETQGITAYATELATQFHAFYRDARMVDPDEPDRSAKRLALALAAKTTLANALGLLGISAPEQM